MLNKRKALIGYAVYVVGKPFAKRALRKKARQVGAVVPGRSRKKPVAVLAGIGALAGGLTFWRRRRPQGGEPPTS